MGEGLITMVQQRYEHHFTIEGDISEETEARYPALKVHRFVNIPWEMTGTRRIPDNVLTAQSWSYSYESAVQFGSQLERNLMSTGLHVVRRKMEVEPQCRLPTLYLETHMRILGHVQFLRRCSHRTSLLHSFDTDRYRDYVTFRTMGSLDGHSVDLNFIVGSLTEDCGCQVIDVETERVVVDTNRTLDSAWEG